MDANQDKQEQANLSDLPELKKSDPDRVSADGAENVKGGAARSGGDDDDLEELQVQRKRKP